MWSTIWVGGWVGACISPRLAWSNNEIRFYLDDIFASCQCRRFRKHRLWNSRRKLIRFRFDRLLCGTAHTSTSNRNRETWSDSHRHTIFHSTLNECCQLTQLAYLISIHYSTIIYDSINYQFDTQVYPCRRYKIFHMTTIHSAENCSESECGCHHKSYLYEWFQSSSSSLLSLTCCLFLVM